MKAFLIIILALSAVGLGLSCAIYRMGRGIADANPGMIELHTFPEAGHGLSFLVDRPRCEGLILLSNKTI